MQNDRKDESAVGWDHVEKVDKHDSQKGKESNNLVLFRTVLVSVPCFFQML